MVPKFLVERFPDIATSLRTAERLIGEFKTAKGVIESCYAFGGLKTVSFSRPKQRFPSTALAFRRFSVLSTGAGDPELSFPSRARTNELREIDT